MQVRDWRLPIAAGTRLLFWVRTHVAFLCIVERKREANETTAELVSAMSNGSDFTSFRKKFVGNLDWPLPACVLQAEELLAELANALGRSNNALAAGMFQIGFGSVRAALILANAGSTGQVPPTLRHALEAGLYAYLFIRVPDFEQTWWDRHSVPKAKNKFSRNGLRRAFEELEQQNAKVCSKAKSSYDNLIDFGAHPNVFQFLGTTDFADFETDPDREDFSVFLLATDKERDKAIIMIVNIVISLIEIYCCIWPERFRSIDAGNRSLEIVGQLRLFALVHYQTE